MRYLISFLLSAFIVDSYAQTIIRDENAEIRTIEEFSGIKVSGGIDVYLSQSPSAALAVSAADQKTRDNIISRVADGILELSYKGGKLNFMDQKKLRVYVSAPVLQSIEASGACEINIQEKLENKSMRLILSGACGIKGKVDIGDIDMDLSGASTSRIEGRVNNLKLKASGASDMKQYNLMVQHLVADISGASDIKISVEKSINLRASGASRVIYSGLPETINVETTGASSAKQRKS